MINSKILICFFILGCLLILSGLALFLFGNKSFAGPFITGSIGALILVTIFITDKRKDKINSENKL